MRQYSTVHMALFSSSQTIQLWWLSLCFFSLFLLYILLFVGIVTTETDPPPPFSRV